MLYLSKKDTVIAQKGEMFEIVNDNFAILSLKTGWALPLKMIRDFDKHFVCFADPKMFRIDGKEIVVGRNAISFAGRIGDPTEFSNIVARMSGPVKILSFQYMGIEMTFKQASEIAAYIDVLSSADARKKFYFTLGQQHRYTVPTSDCTSAVWDKNSVLEVSANDWHEARNLIFGRFGDKWGHQYDTMDDENLAFYPKGIIVVHDAWLRLQK